MIKTPDLLDVPLDPDAAEVLGNFPRYELDPARLEALRSGLAERVAAGDSVALDLPPPSGSAGGGAVTILGGVLTVGVLIAVALTVGGGPETGPMGELAPRVERPVSPQEPSPVVEPREPPPVSALAPALPSEWPEPVPSAKARPKPKPKPKPAGAKATAKPTAGDVDTTADEARLLAGAQRALKGGDPNRALEITKTHARRYPQGKLIESREATRAAARCALEPERGPGILAEFRAAHGNSAFSGRVERSCGRTP